MAAYPTPVTFCEISPPDDFPLYFYRQPKAPDLEIHAPDLDLDAVRDARIFWMTGTGLSAEPSRTATLAALSAPERPPGRPPGRPPDGPGAYGGRTGVRRRSSTSTGGRCSGTGETTAPRRPVRYREALAHATVAVGNIEECAVATGEREPYAAARALLAAGVELAVVKQGPKGVLALHRDGTAADCPPLPVEVVNGLGAGDAFGGALCHGLLAGWPLDRVVRYANAAGAIVASRLACSSAMPFEGEVEQALAARGPRPPCPRTASRPGPPRPARPRSGRMTPVADSLSALVRLRAERPEAVAEAAARRKRRRLVRHADDRLMIVAAATARLRGGGPLPRHGQPVRAAGTAPPRALPARGRRRARLRRRP
ncbi:5-dehydro-2-deoxygluconokinase [Streptomyces microflavus]